MQVFGNTVRFAIYVPPHGVSVEDYVDVWQRAEALGFDAGYLTDHLVIGQSSSVSRESSIFEGLTLLAALATKTSRMRCGINVVANTFRNPGHVAKIAATLDHISNGRLELGLGSGHIESEHEQYGIPFYTQGKRLRMLREAASAVKSLLTADITNLKGRYYTFTDAVCEPKPIQSAVPIIIGGIGEELTPRIVAESADIWNVHLRLPLAEYQRKLDILRRFCEQAGRDPDDIRKSMIVMAKVAKTEADVQSSTGEGRPQGLALSGTPEQVAASLLEYVALGVSDFLFYLRAPFDMDSLELIAKEVAPIVKDEGASLLSGTSAG